MNSLDDLLKRVWSKGDVGVAFLAFALGYLLSLKLKLLSLTPEKLGVLSASGAIGLKNSVEAILEWFSVRHRYRRSVNHVTRLCASIKDLPEVLAVKAQAVSAEYELWEAGIVDDLAVQAAISDFGNTYQRLRGTLPIARWIRLGDS